MEGRPNHGNKAADETSGSISSSCAREMPRESRAEMNGLNMEVLSLHSTL